MSQTWPELIGLPVLDTGNETVCSLLNDQILHTEMYKHSYPYDWRTKLPVIVRASKQWFLDTAAIKNQSIVNIHFLIKLSFVFFLRNILTFFMFIFKN